MSPKATDPEARARKNIDAALEEAGWVVQDRDESNLAASVGVAIREFKTDAGPCDYLLFVNKKPAGIIEAKREGIQLTGIEAQTRDYADKLPKWTNPPLRPLPFLYESTGVETRFTNLLDPTPRSRRVFSFHQPQTLADWFEAAIKRQRGLPDAPVAPTFLGRMAFAPPLNEAGMWPAQIRAVRNLEDSIRHGRPRALIQMATGSGKTFTAISAIYRLIKFGGARRVLFLVDRGNLGKQAYKEFQAYTTPDDGRKFTELYNVARLSSNKIDPVNLVVITTIQRLYSILRGEPEYDEQHEESSSFTGSPLVREPPPVVYNRYLPPEFFDIVVIDECHRSIYSLWLQVLEYFDAGLIGLTATPGRHTFAFFDKNVVSEYRHEHAVRDKVNVPYEVYQIRTKITAAGASLAAEESDVPTVVGKRDRQSRAVRWETLDEDLSYAPTALDRSVVVKDQIRTVIREFKDKLFTEIFPGRTEIPKTLFFAKNDNHAEDILDVIRQEFGIGNEQAVKITYRPEKGLGDVKRVSASHKPEEVIQRFRNSFNPRIAVTVDMIATGTDIKPLECVVFMRTVKSHGLFEQMKGRGVRVIDDADFQAVTPDAKTKTHFVIVDAVGVMDDPKCEPPILRDRNVTLKAILEMVRANNRDEDVLSTLAARLDRLERRLRPDERDRLAKLAGGLDLHALVARLLDSLDPDNEDQKARELFGLAPDVEPTRAQIAVAQAELREGAASALAYSPDLCTALLEVGRRQDQTLDHTSIDEVLSAGWQPQHASRVDDAALVQSFQSFIAEHRDAIDALRVLYARPYGQRLTRQQIKELADAIQLPPRSWTTDALWAAYEKVEKSKVRASGGKLWTDIVALARHALHPDEDIVPFAEQINARFSNWLAAQTNRGRSFDTEQLRWLEMIRDQIAKDVEVRIEDFDDTPFLDVGGLGRFYEVFGEEYEAVVAELNEELVA
ncbi:type I restriction-modification enzyme R subunit C-terminal domain-containing protein [Nannocystaceae bacterium ST9]